MVNPKQKTLYAGTFIHCTTLGKLEILSDTTIGVDEHGKIAFITPSSALSSTLSEHNWESSILQHFPTNSQSTTSSSRTSKDTNIRFFFPGFLDTHIHASQHPNAGIFGKTTLLSWLETYTFPLEASLSDAKKASAVYQTCVSTTLSHGTTTAAYYATISTASTDILAATCLTLGQRAFVGRCAMDNHTFQPAYYRDASAETAISDSRASAESILAADPSRLVQPIITPRFALSCTEQSLKGLAAVASELDIPVQTHISENIAEIALVAEHFPAYPSYAGLYHACGLLGPRTVLAHACHLSAEEVHLVKSTRSSISHCPVSNTSLGSGMCPVRELLEQGITVGLGSDVSGGYSPSILVAAREAGSVSRLRTAPGVSASSGAGTTGTSSSAAAGESGTVVPSTNKDTLKLTVEETLYLATRGGAACLGLQDIVGGFEVGKEWDALYIDLGPELGHDLDIAPAIDVDLDNNVKLDYDPQSLGCNPIGADSSVGNVQVWNWMGWEERIAKWVHQGDERNVAGVWVRGRMVVDRYGYGSE